MEFTVTNGRPFDTSGRLDREIRTYDLLDKLEALIEKARKVGIPA